jgi:hypothetical protein
VLKKTVLRRTFGPKRSEVTRERRKLHNKELNELYCSPNIVRVMKSRREAYRGFWWGNLRERGNLADPGVDGRLILRRIFGKWDMDWIDLAQVRDRWRALLNAVMNLRVTFHFIWVYLLLWLF